MAWTLTERIDDFELAAGAFLRADPARNTVLLSILAELRASGSGVYGTAAPVFGWWAPAGEVAAACLRTPPHPLLVTGLDQAAALALATAWGDELPGVTGREAEALAFAAALLASAGSRAEVHLRTRLYRLAELTPPPARPAGSARLAGPADTDVVLAWYQAFGAEVGNGAAVSRPVIDGKLRDGRLMLWELSGGPVVSMAGMNRTVAGVARIGPVYTPPEYRGHGYGSAATEAVTRAALDRGAAEVVLFTDLANPVSNSIYYRLGYRPVEDQVMLSFPAAPANPPG